jgi:hypothetical protein
MAVRKWPMLLFAGAVAVYGATHSVGPAYLGFVALAMIGLSIQYIRDDRAEQRRAHQSRKT